jgi:hypothetical protein
MFVLIFSHNMYFTIKSAYTHTTHAHPKEVVEASQILREILVLPK